MEIDEQWQTGKMYMRILENGKNSDQDDKLLREIKERVKTQVELVVI